MRHHVGKRCAGQSNLTVEDLVKMEVLEVQNRHLEEASREKEEKDKRKGEDDKIGYLQGMDLPPSESDESDEEED